MQAIQDWYPEILPGTDVLLTNVSAKKTEGTKSKK